MKQMRIVLLPALSIFQLAALGQGSQNTVQPTLASIMDREIGMIEKQIAEVAEEIQLLPGELEHPRKRL